MNPILCGRDAIPSHVAVDGIRNDSGNVLYINHSNRLLFRSHFDEWNVRNFRVPTVLLSNYDRYVAFK